MSSSEHVAESLVLFGLFLAACPGRAGDTRTEAPPRDTQPSTHAKYWLTNTVLAGERTGERPFEVTAPRLVELLPGGRVRSIMGEPKFEGTLPEETLQAPQKNRGLMLYVQEVGELHWRRPDGPILGRVHPGAWLSVAPAEGPRVRIDNLPFERSEPLVAYVDSKLLGTEQREPLPFKPVGPLRSVQFPGLIGWIDDPATGRTEAAWTAIDCVDVWVSQDQRKISQYEKGVELIGQDANASSWSINTAAVYYDALQCTASAVSRRGSELLWHRAGVPVPTKVDRIPDRYNQVELPGGEPLADAIQRGARLYWLLQTGKGISCDQWKFDPSKKRPAGRADAGDSVIEGRVVRRERLSDESGTGTVSFPFEYLRSHIPPVLKLRTLQVNGRDALKCSCDYAYTVLRAREGELEVMGRTLPENPVAYDPGEAERWFLSEEKCNSARAEVAAALDRDSLMATGLGLHAVLPAFGF